MIYWIIFAILLFTIVLLVLERIRNNKTIIILTSNNTKLEEDIKILKYNYDNILKVYKSTLNKIRNLQRQLKNKGK